MSKRLRGEEQKGNVNVKITLDGEVVREERFNRDNLRLNEIVKSDIQKYVSPVKFQMLYISGGKSRLMVIVPIPEKTKCHESPHDNPYLEYCSSLGFFKSTGTSNDWSFEGIYLPFAGISSIDKWIRKIGSEVLSPWHLPIMEYVLQKLKSDNTLKKKGLSTLIVYKFLMRFGDWRMLQISAALGGSLWNTIPELKYIKEFILKNNLVECKNIRFPLLVRFGLIIDGVSKTDQKEEEVIIEFENHLFSEKFYYDEYDVYALSNDIIQEYYFSQDIIETPDLNLVNEKMREYNAFCFDPKKLKQQEKEKLRNKQIEEEERLLYGDEEEEFGKEGGRPKKYVDLKTGTRN